MNESSFVIISNQPKMKGYQIIPEKEYQKIINLMPIFCVDFLIQAEGKYLLLKRNQEPQKNIYWVIGGRLRFKEKIEEMNNIDKG